MERELIQTYVEKKAAYEEAKTKASNAHKEMEKVKGEIIEYMEDTGKERTASYEGLGSISLCQPTPRARVEKGKEDELFNYLTDVGRTDLIKTSIHPATLSSYVRELIEEGGEIPEYISVWMQPRIRLNN